MIARVQSRYCEWPLSDDGLWQATPAVRCGAIKVAIARIPIMALEGGVGHHDDRTAADLRRIKIGLLRIRLLRQGGSEAAEHGRDAKAKRNERFGWILHAVLFHIQRCWFKSITRRGEFWFRAWRSRKLSAVRGEKLSSAPTTFPVWGLTRCTRVHTAQLTGSNVVLRWRIGSPALHIQAGARAAIDKHSHGPQ